MVLAPAQQIPCRPKDPFPLPEIEQHSERFGLDVHQRIHETATIGELYVVFLPLTTTPAVAYLLVAVEGNSFIFVEVLAATLLQRIVRAKVMSSVFGIIDSLTVAGTVLGAIPCSGSRPATGPTGGFMDCGRHPHRAHALLYSPNPRSRQGGGASPSRARSEDHAFVPSGYLRRDATSLYRVIGHSFDRRVGDGGRNGDRRRCACRRLLRASNGLTGSVVVRGNRRRTNQGQGLARGRLCRRDRSRRASAANRHRPPNLRLHSLPNQR